MSGRKGISESEWQLMELLWREGPLTQPQMMKLLGAKWNKNTVHTFLGRLTEKGYLRVEKDASPHRYFAVAPREDCVRQEEKSFLERVYQGSVCRMVASFVRDSELTKEEAEELRRLLDEKLSE